MKVPFFGVDATTRQLAFEPLPLEDVAEIAGKKPDAEMKAQEGRKQQGKVAEDALGVTDEVDDPEQLGQTGWAIVWGESCTAEIKQALEPLIRRRNVVIEATRRAEDKGKARFRELEIKRTDTLETLRQRWGFAPGPVSPNVVPAYLLLVGPPTDISFDLQHDLDVEFFVGRLDFDTADAYAEYAKAVVAAENAPTRPKRAVFFGTQHPNDPATTLSLPNLVTPLAQKIEERQLVAVERAFGDAATKATLAKALGADVPALLFTGGHGALIKTFATDAERADQRAVQGALITQEWPNDMNRFGPLPVEERFAASDLAGRLDGLIAVLFACYGGGTPKRSRFPYAKREGIRDLAPTDFTARLPQQMLARGAGAVIAHVERTWDTGFSWQDVPGPQLDVWTSVVGSLLKGRRAGRAVGFLNERYSSIGAQLSRELTKEQDENIMMTSDRKAYMWTQNQDARSWILLGDPAARIAYA